MLRTDSRAARAMMEMRLDEAQRRANSTDRLLQAGIEPRRRLSRPACLLLCQLGRLLVAMGRRLERFDVPQSLPLRGEVRGTG